MAVQITVITDTSVLINFLVIDQVSLLVAMVGRRIVVTDHVRNEVTQHYPAQLARLEQALQAGLLDEISVTDLAEVALFAQLTATGLGVGECSAIAVAANRGHALACRRQCSIRQSSFASAAASGKPPCGMWLV